jgi:Mce-associated membrane protein
MSPRRKIQPGETPLLTAQPLAPGRPWGLPVASALAAVLTGVAITVSTLVWVSHESRERTASKDREALNYVRGFMAEFTSIDPYPTTT